MAKILIDCGSPEELVVAGLLHDTLEDTPVTLDEIQRSFGPEVARLVNSVSEPDKKAPWETRKQHTIDRLRKASEEILLLACADKLDNIRAMREDYAKLGDSLWPRFNRPRESQQWYFQTLAGVFKAREQSGAGVGLFKEFLREVEEFFGLRHGVAIPETWEGSLKRLI